MNFQHFKILMWKNYRLKLYQWVSTLFEILLPIAITVIAMFVIFQLSINTTARPKSNGTKPPEPLINPPEFAKDILSDMVTVYYAPSNPVISHFMGELKSIKFRNITALQDETELERHVINSNKMNAIGVHFLNVESNTMPDKLSYILRQPLTEKSGGSFPYDNVFIGMQLLISENFIEYKTNKTALKLELQKFPSVIGETLSIIFYIILSIFIAILILSIPLIGNILEERNSGMKELIKITGVKEWMIWLCWFFNAMCSISISLTIVTCLMEMFPLSHTGVTLVRYIPFIVLWPFLILYCAANISFCFMFSSIFQNGTIASISFVIYYFAGFLVFDSVPYSSCLFPTGAFYMGLNEIVYFESNEIDLTWSKFTSTHNRKFRYIPLGLLLTYLLLIFHTLLYFFLTYYITNINPGKFGTPKSPLFLFERLFSETENIQSEPITPPEFEINSKYFETPPSHLETTIEIVDLHKQFKSVHAVRGVNLRTFEGEITALLGHNGAGKTTTMSILTGLTAPTSGSVYYKNSNVLENMDKFRLVIGLCPQENRSFRHLSVMDHLLFFGQLKGLSKQEAIEEADEYLTTTGLISKRNSKVDELSGGMKRKLCLCISMMGKTEVLILDEPSSGMDTESRRSLWDLLLKLREGRSIILTTHHMEEADALGDRIAIMNNGIIVCFGTAMFLKKVFETGYELTITKIADFSNTIAQVVLPESESGIMDYWNGSLITNNSNLIAGLIKSAIPTASVVSETNEYIVFKLPLTETHRFPEMFRNLEKAQMRLGIQHMGVSATTMENVFLLAGGASAYDPESPKIDKRTAYQSSVIGVELFFQQLWAVLKKKFLFTTRDSTTIFMRIFLPTLILYWVIRESDELPGQLQHLSLSSYPKSKVIYQEVNPIISLEKQFEEYVTENKGILKKGDGTDLEQTLISLARETSDASLQDYLCAFSVNGSSARLAYSLLPYASSVSLSIYHNVLLRSLDQSKRYSIEIGSHPIPEESPNSTWVISGGCANKGDSLWKTLDWFFVMGFFTADLLSYFSSFVSAERIDGFYHIQMMSRLSPFVYWLGTLLFDVLLFFIFMIRFMTFLPKPNYSKFIDRILHISVIYLLILVLFGISGTLMIYIFSFFINTKEGSFKFYFTFHATIGILVVAYHLSSLLWHEDLFNADNTGSLALLFLVVWILTLIIPVFTYFMVFLNLMTIFEKNSSCMKCVESYKAICEAQLKKTPYWEFPSKKNRRAILIHVIALSVQIIVFSITLFLFSSGISDRLFNKLKILVLGSESNILDQGDDDVMQESRRVEELKNENAEETQQVSLLVDGLRKNYLKDFRNFTAVSDTSFAVEFGTCFGLLGVNGAGKTTTFKMLTAEIVPTKGDASIDGVKLSEDRNKYLYGAGYCAQTNCFIEQLTAVEILTLIASMRGVKAADRKELVNSWISMIGLDKYKDRTCGNYSGGNKRKLCSVMSLIGDPKVVFLDEPTSGVDPVSRRNLYDVMTASKRLGQTVILTSHSMEECETLCDRLTIMVKGVLKCIGTVQHLKRSYAQGFSALIKIIDSSEARDNLQELKEHIVAAFSPSAIILKDEHIGLLYYQITDTSLLWSVLFRKMENAKEQFPHVVDDYVLTDTTLEEVFISFAKSQ